LFICKDDIVLLNPTTQADFEYQWFPATGLEDSFEALTIASPSTTTEYYLIGKYENCFDSIRQLVEVSDVDLAYDPQAEICGLPIYLRAFVDDSTELSWSVSADFSTTVEQDSFLVSSHGTYYIRATKDSCVKTGAIDVALSDDCCSDKNIIIPNAFTPNGDLLNDRFRIKDELNIIREFELNVFNRWGQKVFFSTQKSDSWDGFFKGELQPTSVFDYHLTIGCVGGETQFFKKGNISLIR
jgi:gliding motility-associated-like protein